MINELFILWNDCNAPSAKRILRKHFLRKYHAIHSPSSIAATAPNDPGRATTRVASVEREPVDKEGLGFPASTALATGSEPIEVAQGEGGGVKLVVVGVELVEERERRVAVRVLVKGPRVMAPAGTL